MNHLAEDILHAYLDAALDESERSAIEAHLAECAHCHAEYAALQRLATALLELPAPALPVDLSQSVVGAITPRWPRRAWAVAALQVAALSLALLLAPALRSAGDLALRAAGLWIGQWLDNSIQWVNASARSLAAAPDAFTHLLHSPLPLPIAIEFTSQTLLLLAGAALIWLAGSGLVLRLPMPQLEERGEVRS